ncbi:MAG: hypothetical protein P8X52_12745, partial [Limibacillus sp.]
MPPPNNSIPLKVLFTIKQIALLVDPGEHVQSGPEGKGSRHERDGRLLRRLSFHHLFGQEQNRRREQQTPFSRGVLLREDLSVKIRHFGVAVQVDLNDKEVVFDVAGQFLARENLLMHLGAVAAAALFDHEHKAFALRVGLCKVLAQVLEGVAH